MKTVGQVARQPDTHRAGSSGFWRNLTYGYCGESTAFSRLIQGMRLAPVIAAVRHTANPAIN
jgi:hypothetical protein